MTQTYKVKHNAQGTIYSLLTVESDGQMTMTFHGTDREICHEANVTEDGRIAVGGSLFPGLESGKWQLMDDVRCKMDDVRCKMDNGRGKMEDGRCNPEPFLRPDSSKRPKAERTVNPEPLTIDHQPSAIDHQPSDIDRPQTSSTLKAVGMVAAATVALFVIYETGLLIPLGLIGLATGGILK